MRSIITVRIQKTDPAALIAMTARALRAAVELHYHILRNLDAQADQELRNIIAARRIGCRRLQKINRLRDEAQAALATYLQEVCRRVRVTKGFTDQQDDDELAAAYDREARETTAYLKKKTERIETAKTAKFWEEYSTEDLEAKRKRLLEEYFNTK